MASSSRRMIAKEFRRKLSVQPKVVAYNEEPVKLYNFGPYQLFSINENKFEAPNHVHTDESQQVLLDNIWNSKTQLQKHRALQALSQYMSSIQKEPTSKNFSHYVVTKGFYTGVFVKWVSVKRVTNGHEWPCYKGFYTLEDALKEPGTPMELIQAIHEMKSQLQDL